MKTKTPITAEQLERWRLEAQRLDGLAAHGSDRRAHVAVMDVSVVLALLDEVDRLKEAFVPRPLQSSQGPLVPRGISDVTLRGWRKTAEAAKAGSALSPRHAGEAILSLLDEIDYLTGTRSHSTGSQPPGIREHGAEVPIAGEELETIVSALPVHAVLRLVIIARTLLDETRRMLAPDERALHARAELKAIVAALPADELARLGALGREILEESTAGAPHSAGD